MAGSLYMGSSDFILSFNPSFSRSQEGGVALLLSVGRSKAQGVSNTSAGVSFLALMISAQAPALLVLCTDLRYLNTIHKFYLSFSYEAIIFNKLTRGDRGPVIQSGISN